MTTYSQMIINAKKHRNPVTLHWDFDDHRSTPCLDGTLDCCGEEGMTYEQARGYVKIFEEEEWGLKWKIVDDVTGRTITNNINEYNDEEDWYEDDEELIAEYVEELQEAYEQHKQEEFKKLAIKKIMRNSIYNNGLGLKLAVKSFKKEF